MLYELTQAFLKTLGQRADALQPLPTMAGQAGAPILAPAFAEAVSTEGGSQAEDSFTLEEIQALSDALKRHDAPRGASAQGRYRRPLFRARA